MFRQNGTSNDQPRENIARTPQAMLEPGAGAQEKISGTGESSRKTLGKR
jgi:hypothetical protein